MATRRTVTGVPAAPQQRPGGWAALRPGEDATALAERVGAAHHRFVSDADGAGPRSDVRTVVLESWKRSRRSGVDPEAAGSGLSLGDVDLRNYRDAHPMSTVLPVVRRLLVEDAVDAGLLVAISDAQGRLLWVEGDTSMRDRAAAMAFAEGADWSESTIGTNAPGTSLAVDHCVQIFGAEHFARPVQPWSCAAAPVHDPVTGAILGAVDITGGARVAAPEVLTLVRATVAAAEAELRLRSFEPSPGDVGFAASAGAGEGPRADGRLRILGAAGPSLSRGAGEVRLSPRHAEILVLLTEHSDGMGAEQLAVALDERTLDAVTVRAEMSRLRRVLGAEMVASRPYRLVRPVLSDAMAVRGALDRGDVAEALRIYRGPVLPDSLAPGIADVRDGVDARIREAVLRSGQPHLLLRWAATASGRDDPAVWQALVSRLPSGSPAYVQAAAQLDLLERRFGTAATRLQRPRP